MPGRSATSWSTPGRPRAAERSDLFVGSTLGQLLQPELHLATQLADLCGVLAIRALVDARADPVEGTVDVVAVLVGEISCGLHCSLQHRLGLDHEAVHATVEVELVDLPLQG